MMAAMKQGGNTAPAPRMPEAAALYTKLGYQETEPWGPFAGDKLCLCMKKELT